MKEYFKENWPLMLIIFGSIHMFRLIEGAEKERDAAISQRDAALQQAEQLAKRVVELQRANPMARVQYMPEALQGD